MREIRTLGLMSVEGKLGRSGVRGTGGDCAGHWNSCFLHLSADTPLLDSTPPCCGSNRFVQPIRLGRAMAPVLERLGATGTRLPCISTWVAPCRDEASHTLGVCCRPFIGHRYVDVSEQYDVDAETDCSGIPAETVNPPAQSGVRIACTVGSSLAAPSCRRAPTRTARAGNCCPPRVSHQDRSSSASPS